MTKVFEYYPASTRFESFDPLDADRAFNLPAMRMLHFTPIEVLSGNTLTSQILSKFSYDADSRIIRFQLRRELTFSDGSLITPDDLAFAISRMAYTRPSFPVISDIVGLSEWLETKTPLEALPAGMRISGDVLEIEFARRQTNPLFRFCLEVFSVIPKRSVDLSTNKLFTPTPPTSGNYIIAADTGEKVTFKRRLAPKFGHQADAPEEIVFRYPATDVDYRDRASFSDATVISGDEFSLQAKGIDLDTSGYEVIWTAASSFSILQLNPHVFPFDDIGCRRMFIEAFRLEAGKVFGTSSLISKSIFTQAMPGYLTEDEFNLGFDRDACLRKLRQAKFPWCAYPVGKNDYLRKIVEATAKALQIPLDAPTLHLTPALHDLAFIQNNSALSFNRTGFWPHDAGSDIRMLFTPELHQVLRNVWGDEKLNEMLNQLGNLTDAEDSKSQMEKINRYIVDFAVFNPISHFRRFLASPHPGVMRNFPTSYQVPYPWQVFTTEAV